MLAAGAAFEGFAALSFDGFEALGLGIQGIYFGGFKASVLMDLLH
jgi:hypothetical protein